MSSIRRSGMAVLAGIMLLAAGQAEARVVSYSGDCYGSLIPGNWTVVITIDDNTGQVTRREGTNCNGTHWVDHCTVSPGTFGASSGYYIQDASANPQWWVRFNADASGNITKMWGKDANGTNWVASTGEGGLE